MRNFQLFKHLFALGMLLAVSNANAGVISFSFTDDPSDYSFSRTHVAGTVTGLLTFSEDLSINGTYLPDAIAFTSNLSWLGASDSIVNMSTLWTHTGTTGFTFSSGNVVGASYSANYTDSGIGGLQFRLNSDYLGMNILHWNGSSGPIVAIGNTDGFSGATYGSAVSVPEPGSLVLLGLGLAGLGAMRRKNMAT